uniref:Delta-aminolevulinic acid dehydratase n=1 Tax=Cyanophora paradoxa TaxID=2762 RepID=Q9ARF7_CYAPA|nr:ALA dehydratase [Cyanophora paradoxa]
MGTRFCIASPALPAARSIAVASSVSPLAAKPSQFDEFEGLRKKTFLHDGAVASRQFVAQTSGIKMQAGHASVVSGPSSARGSSYALAMRRRPRRNRKGAAMRGMYRETTVGPENFILPLFIHDGDDNQPISAMPGCFRLSREGLLKEVEGAYSEGIRAVVLFPKVPDNLKTSDGAECFNPDGIVPRTVRMLKEKFPELLVITDIALDPYNSDGHDGIVDKTNGKIINDETVEQLCKQALCHAAAGADIVSPSDMMDGRIGAIRDALDGAGYTDVSILSYCAKYASAYYGPFRTALDSDPRFGDKTTYQMDPANVREALIEAELDLEEGADMIMVKPGLPYLDVIKTLRENSPLPIAAYQVSGEYAMIKAAVANGWLDERKVVMESLIALRRAGADFILTYFARPASRWIAEDREAARKY